MSRFDCINQFCRQSEGRLNTELFIPFAMEFHSTRSLAAHKTLKSRCCLRTCFKYTSGGKIHLSNRILFLFLAFAKRISEPNVGFQRNSIPCAMHTHSHQALSVSIFTYCATQKEEPDKFLFTFCFTSSSKSKRRRRMRRK